MRLHRCEVLPGIGVKDIVVRRLLLENKGGFCDLSREMDLRNPVRAGVKPEPGRTLVCLRGAGQGFEGRLFFVTSEGAEIGRNPESEIQLNHPTVSRRHCRIEMGPGGARVKDLGSVNGTWVNGVMRMDCWLRPFDVLRVGGVDLVVEMRPASDALASDSEPGQRGSRAGTTRLMDVDDVQGTPITPAEPPRPPHRSLLKNWFLRERR